MTAQHSAPDAFTYDYAGRMLSAANFGGQPGMNQSLSYDAAGSIRSNSRVGSYSYGAPSAAHPHAPTSVAGNAFTYDLNGNMLVGPPPSAGMTGRTASYDGENRPASVVEGGLTTAYTYAADGSRLLRSDPAGKIVATFGPVEIRDIGGPSETVLTYPHPDIRLKNGTEVTYLHRDHLSSVRTMTNAAGARAAWQVYVPFGEQVQIGAPLDPEETKGFIGERYDSDAGLQYLNARYYDPRLGMFIQPDWFEVTKAGVGTNRYAYSFNNPVNLRDPRGNQANPEEEPQVGPDEVTSPANDNKPPSIKRPETRSRQGLRDLAERSWRAIGRMAAAAGLAHELEELNNDQNRLYRGLSPYDLQNIREYGEIRPKNPEGNLTMEEHALDSDMRGGSQYISLTTDPTVAERFSLDSTGVVVVLDGQQLMFSGGLRAHTGLAEYSKEARDNVISESEVLYEGNIPWTAFDEMYYAPGFGQ